MYFKTAPVTVKYCLNNSTIGSRSQFDLSSNSDLAKWKFIQRYITISSGNDYWFSDDPFIDPSVHPEWRPVIVSELGMSTPDLFVTKAVFSEYGTLGVKFNRQVSGNHAMVLAILYLSD